MTTAITSDHPRLSVILPTWNRMQYLPQALNSVLEQRNADFEVVVSDNASTDGTAEYMRQFEGHPRVRYSRNETNLGMIGNWRKAIFELARGEWFLLMSDDDYFTDPDYLHDALALIEQSDPRFVYAGGDVLDIESGRSQRMTPPFEPGLVDGTQVFASRGTVQPQDIILCNLLFRISDARRLGFLNNENNLSTDSELYLKLCAEGQVGVIPRSVCVYRWHPGNLIKTVQQVPERLAGNLEFLVLPYAHARNRGVDAQTLATFRHNIGLGAKIRDTLASLYRQDRDLYAATLTMVRREVPELMPRITRQLWLERVRSRLRAWTGRPQKNISVW
jgi:hypothetical protein